MEKVKVIGCGGIGLYLLDPLCRYLQYQAGQEFEISLVDGDIFEPRNRERQQFREIGAKASVSAARLREDFPELSIIDHPVYINEGNISTLIEEGDMVLLCVDNHATRKIVDKHAQSLHDVVVISGGNDYEVGDVLVYIRRDGEDLTVPMSVEDPAIAEPADKHPEIVKKDSCMALAPSAPQLVVANFAAAQTMLSAVYGLHQEVFTNEYSQYNRAMFDVRNNSGRVVFKKPAQAQG